MVLLALGHVVPPLGRYSCLQTEAYIYDRYTGADGKPVELKGVSLPWASDPFEVKGSFKASLEAKAVYNEAELSDNLVYGALGAILNGTDEVAKSGEIGDYTKADFLQMVTEEPEQLYTKVNHDF